MNQLMSYIMPTSLINYVLFTKNYVMMAVYLTMLSFGFFSYTLTAYQYISESWWGQIPFVLLALNLIFFYASAKVDPGIITKNNVDKLMKKFEYDELMYKEKECHTCELLKPARSKHCGICNHCVSRFDHHCNWVNNCIGGGNHKYFLLFLLSLVAMTFSATFLILMVFIHIIDTRNLHSQFFTDDTGEVYQATVAVIVSFLVGEYALMSFLFIYLALLFIALAIFFCYHLFLIITNITTNEVAKILHTTVFCRNRDCCEELDNERCHDKLGERGKIEEKVKHRNTSLKKEPELMDKKTYSLFLLVFSFYNKGIIGNICEVFLE